MASAAGWRVGQHGFAFVVATARGPLGRTALTRISHRSPARLLPMRTAAAEEAGAALCAIGSHGGGLLGGDVVDVDVVVGARATLALSTQSSTKIYRTTGLATEQRLRATVSAGGLLVNAPDALVPFASSDFEQTVAVALEPGGSAVMVDWIGAGRVANGERWAFRRLWSRTELHLLCAPKAAAPVPGAHCAGGAWAHADRPAELVEALCLDRPPERASDGPAGAREFGLDFGSLAGDAAFGACATVVLAGPRAARCAEAFQLAALRCAAMRARTRTPSSAQPQRAGPAGRGGEEEDAARETAAVSDAVDAALGALASDVHVGVSRLELRHEPSGPTEARATTGVAVVRLGARRGEDMARVLAACLSPLTAQLGSAPYADRLHGRATAAFRPRDPAFPPLGPPARAAPARPSAQPAPAAARLSAEAAHPLSSAAQWRLGMLVDSCLPTGGFAHSCGLEAAKQILLGAGAGRGGAAGGGRARGGAAGAAANDTVAAMLAASARSSARLHSAFVASAHAAVAAAARPGGEEGLRAEWAALDAALEALLCGHETAAKASRLQGAALARVAGHWLGADAGAPGGGRGGSAGARLLAHVHGAAGGAGERPPSGVHASVVFGALAATLEIPLGAAMRAYSFVSARDALSAAVRLDLVGPLHAVALMATLEGAARDGERAAEHAARHALLRAGLAPQPNDGEWPLGDALGASRAARLAAVRHAAGCAPLLDTVHACHDLLEMRLFQT